MDAYLNVKKHKGLEKHGVGMDFLTMTQNPEAMKERFINLMM